MGFRSSQEFIVESSVRKFLPFCNCINIKYGSFDGEKINWTLRYQKIRQMFCLEFSFFKFHFHLVWEKFHWKNPLKKWCLKCFTWPVFEKWRLVYWSPFWNGKRCFCLFVCLLIFVFVCFLFCFWCFFSDFWFSSGKIVFRGVQQLDPFSLVYGVNFIATFQQL